MLRKLWLAGLVATMMTTAACSASAEASIYLGCQVSGAEASGVADFATLLCDQAATQMREATGKPVQIAAPGEIDDHDAPWLRLEVVIKSAYGASARASWGGAGMTAGESPEVEAGIDDDSLNEATATMLVNVLLNQTPYMTRK